MKAPPAGSGHRPPTNSDVVPRGLQIILVALTLILLIFGGWRFLNPIGFYTFNDLMLPAEPGLLSEVRAAGAIMVAFGVLVGWGAFRRSRSRRSIVIAAVLFSALAIGRLMGFALDGTPGSGVLTGSVIEAVCAAAALFALIRFRA